MTALPAIGEVEIDRDGVLSGWCFSPARPAERVTIEILVNQSVVTTLVASRFREDLRNRGIGDGYHGFSVTLTKQIDAIASGGIVSAREKLSGTVIWHWISGEFSLPAEFPARLAAARAQIGALAESPLLRQREAREVAAAFSAAGALLAPPQPARSLAYSAPRNPAVSLILDDAPDWETALPKQLATLAAARLADIVIADAQPRPALAGTLPYLACADAARRRTMAAGLAGGRQIVFLRHAGSNLLATALAAQRGVIIGEIPALARLGAAIPRLADAPAATGLALACPRALWDRLGGLNPELDGDLDIADFALRASTAGIPLTAWPGAAAAKNPASAGALTAFLTAWRPAAA
jgi:hypothetical protein